MPMTPRAVPETLAAVLAGLRPAPAERVPLARASGRVLAENVVAPVALPAAALALRPGYAVASLDLVGASAQSPVWLADRPALVAAGDTLPVGCDAVIDADAVAVEGSVVEVSESPVPGQNARRAGEDARIGATICRSGERLTAERLLACQLGGVSELSVRRFAVRIAITDQAIAAWLAARLVAHGCTLAGAEEAAALTIGDAHAELPALALRPGERARIAAVDGDVDIGMPTRFDGAVAAYVALILPVLAHLLGQAPRWVRAPLTGKLISAIGASELALFALTADGAEPLATGEVTLGALASADAVALLPPGLEGYAAGTTLAMMLLADPLGPPSLTLSHEPS